MPKQLKIPFAIDRSGGVSFTTNGRVVDQMNVTTIVGTEPGERCMRPTYGVRTRHLVFENTDNVILSNELRSSIEQQVDFYEPRVAVDEVAIEFPGGVADPEGAKIKARVSYNPAAGRLADEPGVTFLTVRIPRGI